MTRFLSACALFATSCLIAVAADPTPEQAKAMLDKSKVKYRTDKKNPENIIRVELNGKRISDDDLRYIGALSKLTDLNLGGVVLKEVKGKKVYAKDQITDKGLAHLAKLTSLTELTLDGTKITDEGLKHLAGMKNLKTLVLSSTLVTDAGMEELKKLPKLETVMLYDTKVTDSGVFTLKKWKIELNVNR